MSKFKYCFNCQATHIQNRGKCSNCGNTTHQTTNRSKTIIERFLIDNQADYIQDGNGVAIFANDSFHNQVIDFIFDNRLEGTYVWRKREGTLYVEW